LHKLQRNRQTFYDDNGKLIRNQIQDPVLRRRAENYWKIVRGISVDDEEQYMPFLSLSRAYMDLERAKNRLPISSDLIAFILAIFGAAIFGAALLLSYLQSLVHF